MTIRGRNIEKKGFGIAGRSYRILAVAFARVLRFLVDSSRARA